MTEHEAKAWKALAATYAQCVEVAIQQWDGLIGVASAAQQKQAEQMRDRTTDIRPSGMDTSAPEVAAALVHESCASIPVPLFTPRDRLQFLKEVSVTLLIEASKRGLTVTDADAPPEPATVPFGKQKGTPIEKVSGIDLQSMIEWVREKADRVSRYFDFVQAAEAEVAKRATATEAIQTQPLTETPLALVTEDRPL